MIPPESRQRSSPGRAGLLAEILATDLDTAREAWTELAQASDSPFATFEWAQAWWNAFGAGQRLVVLGCRRPDGSLAALLPLCQSRLGPVRVARFVGHGPADELGPICAPDDRPAALAALRESMAGGLVGSDLFLGERMPAQPAVDEAFGGRRLHVEAAPALATEGLTWDEFLAGRSRNFREQIRRRERALARDHEVTYRLTEDPERVDADLSTLFALHQLRWGEEGSGAFAGPRGSFHREFAAAALGRGWLRLWILEADGAAVAAWYGLRFAGQEWFYQSGRDPAWDARSVGTVLFAHTIRAAMEDGVREYRFLRGGESYKRRYATHDHPLQTRVAGATPLGRAAVGALALAGPHRPRVRGLLKRVGG